MLVSDFIRALKEIEENMQLPLPLRLEATELKNEVVIYALSIDTKKVSMDSLTLRQLFDNQVEVIE